MFLVRCLCFVVCCALSGVDERSWLFVVRCLLFIACLGFVVCWLLVGVR